MPAPDRPPLHLQATQARHRLGLQFHLCQPALALRVLLAVQAAVLLAGAPLAQGWVDAASPLVADGQVAGGAGDGSAVQQRFLFTSTGAGSHTLKFLLQRPWGETPAAVQPVLVDVR